MYTKKFLIICFSFYTSLMFAQPEKKESMLKSDNPYQIPYERYQLPNGLNILVHEDHSDPVVHVDVTYHVGSAREELGRSGFAHFYEHMMFQGSDHVGDEQHFKMVSAAGGTLNGTTNTDRTNYFETLPSNQLEVALWLEADRMGFLLDAVTQKKFEVQRSTVKNERGQNYDNRPYGLVNEKICQALYPYGHPYSWPTIGYLKDLDRATLDDLKQFFLRWYGPNNAVLTVSGDVKTEQVVKLAEKYFGTLQPCPQVPPVVKTRIELDKDRFISYEDNVRLPMISVNTPTVPMNERDEVALDALADILSGNKNTLIYRRMVNDQKALSARCIQQNQELAGRFIFSATPMTGTTPDQLFKMYRDILDEIASYGVTQEEVDRYIISTEAELMNQLNSVRGKGALLAANFTFTGDASFLVKKANWIKSLKADDVIRVFNEYIYHKPAVILSVYPKNQPTMVAGFDNYQPDTAYTGTPPPAAEKMDLTYTKAKDNFNRAQIPAPGPAPVVKVPEFWKKTFENKLKIIGTYADEIPMVTLQLNIAAGHFNEKPDKGGLAYLTAELMKRSTQKTAEEAISQKLSNMGSSIDISANATDIQFSVNCFVKHLDSTLALLHEILFYPLLDMDEFEKAKEKVIQQNNQQLAQAQVLANNVYNRILYGDKHVFSAPVTGYNEVVDAITVEEVRNYYQTAFGPEISSLVVVGMISEKELLPKLDFLKNWKPGTRTLPADPAVPVMDKTKLYFVNKDKAPQSEIRIGYVSLPYDVYGDFYKCQLMNFVLGGTFNSRINLNLREDKGFTYGARSSFNGSFFKGPFTVSTGVRASATDSSVAEIMKELNRYITSGITTEELTYTKNSLSQSEALKYETYGQKAALLKRIADYNLDDHFTQKQNKILASITADEINKISKTYLPINKMAIVVVGDKEKVYEPLKKLGYEINELTPDGKPIDWNFKSKKQP